MKITLSRESGSDKIYQVNTDEPSSIAAVEGHAEIQQMTQSKQFSIEGDMDDPSLFWMTISE